MHKLLTTLALTAAAALLMSIPKPAAASPSADFPVTFHTQGKVDVSVLNQRLAEALEDSSLLEQYPELEGLSRMMKLQRKQQPERFSWQMSLNGPQLFLSSRADGSDIPADTTTGRLIELGGTGLDLESRIHTGEVLFSASVAHPVEQFFIYLDALDEIPEDLPGDEQAGSELEDLKQNLRQFRKQLDTVGGEEGLKRVIGDQADFVVFPGSKGSEMPVSGALIVKIDDSGALQGWLSVLGSALGVDLNRPDRKTERFRVYSFSQQGKKVHLGVADSELFLTNDSDRLLELYHDYRGEPLLPPQQLTSSIEINARRLKKTFAEEKSPVDLERTLPKGELLALVRDIAGLDPDKLGTVRLKSSIHDQQMISTMSADSDLLSALVYGAFAGGMKEKMDELSEDEPHPGGAGFQEEVHRRNFDKLAGALNKHRKRHGHFPDSLHRLTAAGTVDELPGNPATGEPVTEASPWQFRPGDVVYLPHDHNRRAELFIFGASPDGGLDTFTKLASWGGYPAPVGSDGERDGVLAWKSLPESD